MLTQALIWLRRSVGPTALAVTLSWALLVDALWFELLGGKLPHRNKVSSIEGEEPCMFKPWQIESPRNTQKPGKHVWRAAFYRTLCNTGVFRTRGIFRTPSNIYAGKFYSEPFVTPAYLEPCHIQNPMHIQNTAKHLSRNILFKTLCNPDIFRNLVYLELWYILRSKHIQNPTEYLR